MKNLSVSKPDIHVEKHNLSLCYLHLLVKTNTVVQMVFLYVLSEILEGGLFGSVSMLCKAEMHCNCVLVISVQCNNVSVVSLTVPANQANSHA